MDFNIDVKDKTNPTFHKLSEFCDTFSMPNLVKDYACLTITDKSSILTDKEHSLQLSKTTETSAIDFHFLIPTSITKKGYAERF